MSSTPLVYSGLAAEPRRAREKFTQSSKPPRTALRNQLSIWLPVAGCLAIFAIESTKYLGADHTSRPFHWIAEALFGSAVNADWDALHVYIRKTGHFLGYGFFSLFCFRAFWLTCKTAASRLRRKLHAHALAILATFLVASADEFHQSFLPNRCGQFSDVLLDACGGAAMGFALFLVMLAVDGLRAMRTRAHRRTVAAYVE